MSTIYSSRVVFLSSGCTQEFSEELKKYTTALAKPQIN